MTGERMQRREFITLLGGATAAWPLAARAQQADRVRRIGVMVGGAEDEPRAQADVTTFRQTLQTLGWTVGRNVQIEVRWGIYNVERARAAAEELVGLADVIVTNGTAPVAAVQRATRTIPVVFTVVYEPVAQGFVQSLRRPGANITGFSNVEPSIGGKWLELLKEIAPRIRRVAVVFNPEGSPFSATIYRAVEAAGPSFMVDTVLVPVYEFAGIEPALARLGREPDGGLIFPPDVFFRNHRKLTVDLTAHYRLPAIYGEKQFPIEGGLVSYGAFIEDQFRQAAGYVDRILRGEKPADLPVQQPVKFQFVLNLKAAKALGIDVPTSILLRADEVIE